MNCFHRPMKLVIQLREIKQWMKQVSDCSTSKKKVMERQQCDEEIQQQENRIVVE